MNPIRDFPYLVLENGPCFPGSSCLLNAVEAPFESSLQAALSSSGRTIALFTSDRSGAPGLDNLGPVGVLAVFRESPEAPVADIVQRIRLCDLTIRPHPRALVEILPTPTQHHESVVRLDGQLRELARQLFSRCRQAGRQADAAVAEIEDGQYLALVYFLASLLPLEPAQALAILACDDVQSAQRQLLHLLQTAISEGRCPALDQRLRETAWLCAEEDDAGEEPQSEWGVREKIETLELDDDLLERLVLPQLEKLALYEPGQSEHQETLRRLESLLTFPWRMRTAKVSPRQVGKALDRIILGHRSAKDTLMDLSIAPARTPSPVLLVGPSGLGQGALARAFAAGQKRHLERIRLPEVGAADLLKGDRNRRPGAVYEAAKRAGSRDPVLLIEAHGALDQNCEHALLELTDPRESKSFLDVGLGLPIDASAMQVVLQVRSLDQVPDSLRQRAVTVSLESYGREEKRAILVGHLWPAALREAGLRSGPLEGGVVDWLLLHHEFRAGVAELRLACQQLARRLARHRATGGPLSASVELARSCFGEPWPAAERSGVGVGVVAFPLLTPSGADIRLAAAFPEGDDEPVEEGWSDRLELASRLARVPTGQNWRCHHDAPEFACDLPGLLLPLTVALRSAQLGVPIPRDLILFGRLDLGGRIEPLGEARERALAAFRSGYRTVLLCPEEAEELLRNLPEEARVALRLIPVSDLESAWVTVEGLTAEPPPRRLPGSRRRRVGVA